MDKGEEMIELQGYMNKNSEKQLKFRNPIKYEISESQRKGLKILTFPRVYNIKPFNLTFSPKRRRNYIKVKIRLEII